MSTELYEINVTLSDFQKMKLSKAFHNRETIKLRLKNDALRGSDTLLVPSTIVKRLEKNRNMNKGMEIKLAKTNIRKQVGGSLLSSILSLGRTFGPTLAKTLGLSALAGVASEGASQVVKKISGGSQTGGFLIPNSKINQLIANKHLLSEKQKRDIINAIQTGSGVHIKPTKKQTGGFLGTLLASIGVPLALEAFKKMVGGSGGVPRIGKPPLKDGGSAPRMGKYQPPPPFYGTWENYGGGEKKKVGGRVAPWEKQSIQRDSTVGNNSLKFLKNVPLSNHDLIKWCQHLGIPIDKGGVLSREQTVPHNHKMALFIYNLEPSYMSGSHWVATFVKDGRINYFDSFGLPPFQEIVNHAEKKNLTLIHQNNQIQDLGTTTCGYFCLYFLNEMNKGSSYFNLLQVFDVHDTMKNERFIERYFEKISRHIVK